MLTGKDFGRRHYAGLSSVTHCQQGGKDSDHGFPRTYISLQQPVHLPAAHHVAADFFDDPLLGTGKIVWQSLVAGIERLADIWHDDACGSTAADVLLLDQGQLQEEEFLPFEPVLGLGQSSLVRREMNIPDRVSERWQSFLPEDVFRKGFGDVRDGIFDGG